MNSYTLDDYLDSFAEELIENGMDQEHLFRDMLGKKYETTKEDTELCADASQIKNE